MFLWNFILVEIIIFLLTVCEGGLKTSLYMVGGMVLHHYANGGLMDSQKLDFGFRPHHRLRDHWAYFVGALSALGTEQALTKIWQSALSRH